MEMITHLNCFNNFFFYIGGKIQEQINMSSTENKFLDSLSLYKEKDSDKLILAYKGNVTSELLASFLQIIELKLEMSNEKVSVVKKVYNVLVEALQNLYHHLDEDFTVIMTNEEKARLKDMATLHIYQYPDNFLISTGNYVKAENVDKLRKRLEDVNALSEERIRELYLQTLNNGEMSEKGGGGLGLIDIVRKSKNKLDYNIEKVNDSIFSFCLNIKVNRNKN